MTDRCRAPTLLPAWLVPVALFFVSAALSAQATRSADDDGRPRARAVATSAEIEVDGRLDDASWSEAPPVTRLTQIDPREGEPVSERTEIRIVYDDDALYVGARLHDRRPVSSRLARRDSYMPDSDWFSVAVDSYHDHLTAYRFMVNPAGVRSDEILSGGDADRGDDSWDPVWEVATTVGDSGWVAEMRIPFSQLRFSEENEQLWGLQLEREIARRQEEAVFAFTPKSERGGIARYGHLAGIEGVRPDAGFEILPYGLTRAEYGPVETADGVSFPDPFRDGSSYFVDGGVDVKYRLASNLTLDATVNPDFGQVEVDPAVVNLTAFETRFEERRPFFVEGGEIFQFGEGGGRGGGGGRFGGGTQLLYSRRIGAPPPGDAPDHAVYEQVPDAATILGAAKLTGRTAGGWNVGFLEAVTAEETLRFVDAEGVRGDAPAAPVSNYFAARVERNLREGRTVVGAIATSVNRSLDGTSLASELRSSAYSAGVDFSHEWGEREWALSGHVAGSRIAGSPEAIRDAQTSSARYFQRPDAEHVAYDPAATSLAGYTADLELRKQAGLHWRGSVELSTTSPGFEVNDLGFQRDADRFTAEASARYEENRPGDVFREWNVQLRSDGTWNYGRERLGSELSLEVGGELLSYWGGEVDFSHSFGGFDDRLTRGGPLSRTPSSNRISAELESDQRKRWTIESRPSFEWDEAGGDQLELGVQLDVRPSESWNLSLGPEFSVERSPAQFVGSLEDPTAQSTFGSRYVFAELDQRTLSLETRLNVTFTPGLTLEVYAQPFLANADFGAVKELAAPRTFSFLEYGRDVGTVRRDGRELVVDPDGDGPAESFRLDDDDFNRRSLRGNAVLRWEWRPGSTLFLVWQHRRSQEVYRNDLDVTRDMGALLDLPSENALLLKVSYWLSP